MAEFLDSEAEESEEEEELELNERKKLKKLKAVVSDSSEEEEDDEERLREELKDLIDDRPIEEEDGSGDSDTASGGDDDDEGGGSGKKRKKHQDDDLDDRLEDDDYDLIEENLGVKVERRKRFKRLRRIHDNESDGEEQHVDEGLAREQIAEQLFDENDESIEHRSERSPRHGEADAFDEEDSESDADDFIVDDNGRPIADKKKKRRPIFTDAGEGAVASSKNILRIGAWALALRCYSLRQLI
ncbi:GL21315 [Drosophila persimilis]|uniref:GL21315 n=1 Tax=Drosophila persimilis TaxID=7234 RepID=B4HB89_DROPE|nr:GL21315 [Drosophila persimilis]